jgi:hypothetical protein
LSAHAKQGLALPLVYSACRSKHHVEETHAWFYWSLGVFESAVEGLSYPKLGEVMHEAGERSVKIRDRQNGATGRNLSSSRGVR